MKGALLRVEDRNRGTASDLAVAYLGSRLIRPMSLPAEPSGRFRQPSGTTARATVAHFHVV